MTGTRGARVGAVEAFNYVVAGWCPQRNRGSLGREPLAVAWSSTPGGDPMDSAAESKRLLERDAQWAAAAAEGRDIERILEFWTDDALVYPPGLPVVAGKTALRAYVQASLAIPGFHITWSSSHIRLSEDGQLAYLLGQNAVTAPGPSGQLTTSRGRAVTVWRREADGEWRCAVDIWNAEPA